jgi:HAD superfamily hydrolase (TIGR01509 family)
VAHPLLDRPAWIFDMDGTLTVPVHDFAALRAQLGIPATDDILGHIDAAGPDRQRALRAAVHAWEEGLADAAVAQADAVALLDALAARGARLGVLTRNTRSTALRTLRAAGLGDRFADADVLGRDEAPAKPAPGGVLALLAAWGLRPDQGVMVGDYLFDARAGRAAGAATVLVLRADDRGWEDEADLVLGDLRALLA